MQRCRTCETTIAPNETECITCGTPVVQKGNPNAVRERFKQLTTILLILSCLLTLAGVFTEYGPPFLTGIAVVFVLILVRQSAGEMAQDGAEQSKN